LEYFQISAKACKRDVYRLFSFPLVPKNIKKHHIKGEQFGAHFIC